MSSKFKRKLLRAVKRYVQRNRSSIIVAAALLTCMVLIFVAMANQNKRLTVNPTTYGSLLQLIAHVESNDNYNAYFGNASNASIDFTKMSIEEVMAWQAEHIQQGHFSSAVGRYQVIDTTLAEMVKQLGIDPKQAFDPATQDKIAMALLERRGAEAYVNGEITPGEFAANLAQEWAALPKVLGENPQESYYHSDGVNQARVSVDKMMQAIAPINAE